MKKFSGFTDLKMEMRRSTGLVAENEWPDSGVTSYDGAFSLSNTYQTMQNAIVNRSVGIEMVSSFSEMYTVRNYEIIVTTIVTTSVTITEAHSHSKCKDTIKSNVIHCLCQS